MNKYGTLEFYCDDKELCDGFNWAKEYALSLAHHGEDVIGKWYEAALPDREGFCIRDMCHQSYGAHALGLWEHTKNMMLRFAQSVSESKDFCCMWEYTKHYTPYHDDYYSDERFWYNLPASFDLLQGCYETYKLTGDRAFIDSEDFLHFYRLTVNQYVKKWDVDGDGIPEGSGNVRGIPSYEENEGRDAAQMIDLLAAEAKAMGAYAEILELRGENGLPYKMWQKCLLAEIDSRWDEAEQRYYFFKLRDGSFAHAKNPGAEYLLHFDAIKDERKLAITLEKFHGQCLEKVSAEIGSYLSKIFYKYGKAEYGEYWLRRFMDPALPRREYPEVSYGCIDAFVFGMMGVKYDLATRSITATPALPAGMKNATLTGLPVYGRYADIEVKDGEVSIAYRDE